MDQNTDQSHCFHFPHKIGASPAAISQSLFGVLDYLAAVQLLGTLPSINRPRRSICVRKEERLLMVVECGSCGFAERGSEFATNNQFNNREIPPITGYRYSGGWRGEWINLQLTVRIFVNAHATIFWSWCVLCLRRRMKTKEQIAANQVSLLSSSFRGNNF